MASPSLRSCHHKTPHHLQAALKMRKARQGETHQNAILFLPILRTCLT